MTVRTLADTLGLKVLTLPEEERECEGVYIGDLLSWVMGRATRGNVWITIMSNLNVLAVASLSDVSCVIFAEGVTPDETLIKTAEAKGVNLLTSTVSAYETAKQLSELGI